jgi:hypothetical protein
MNIFPIWRSGLMVQKMEAFVSSNNPQDFDPTEYSIPLHIESYDRVILIEEMKKYVPLNSKNINMKYGSSRTWYWYALKTGGIHLVGDSKIHQDESSVERTIDRVEKVYHNQTTNIFQQH